MARTKQTARVTCSVRRKQPSEEEEVRESAEEDEVREILDRIMQGDKRTMPCTNTIRLTYARDGLVAMGLNEGAASIYEFGSVSGIPHDEMDNIEVYDHFKTGLNFTTDLGMPPRKKAKPGADGAACGWMYFVDPTCELMEIAEAAQGLVISLFFPELHGRKDLTKEDIYLLLDTAMGDEDKREVIVEMSRANFEKCQGHEVGIHEGYLQAAIRGWIRPGDALDSVKWEGNKLEKLNLSSHEAVVDSLEDSLTRADYYPVELTFRRQETPPESAADGCQELWSSHLGKFPSRHRPSYGGLHSGELYLDLGGQVDDDEEWQGWDGGLIFRIRGDLYKLHTHECGAYSTLRGGHMRNPGAWRGDGGHSLNVLWDNLFKKLVGLRTLADLRLDNNCLDDPVCECIAILMNSGRLRYLSLRWNCIGDYGARALARGLTGAQCRVEVLDLDKCPRIGREGWAAVEEALCNKESIGATSRSNHILTSLGIGVAIPTSLKVLLSVNLDGVQGRYPAARAKVLKEHFPPLGSNNKFPDCGLGDIIAEKGGLKLLPHILTIFNGWRDDGPHNSINGLWGAVRALPVESLFGRPSPEKERMDIAMRALEAERDDLVEQVKRLEGQVKHWRGKACQGESGGPPERQDEKGAGQSKDNPKYEAGLFGEYKRRKDKNNQGIKSKDIRAKIKSGDLPALPPSKVDPSIDMCLAWHTKGMCNPDCPCARDHEAEYSNEEYRPLKSWCIANYPGGVLLKDKK